MRANLTRKLRKTVPFLRRLGKLYLFTSGAMFLFGFTSTLIFKLS